MVYILLNISKNKCVHFSKIPPDGIKTLLLLLFIAILFLKIIIIEIILLNVPSNHAIRRHRLLMLNSFNKFA